MAEQVRDPFRILHIGLTPWNLLDMLRIRHHNLQASFQNRVDRLPIHPRALHRHMGAAFREQPFAQTHQLSCRRAERSHLLLDFPVPANHQQASHYRGLMYVQSTTALDQCLHNASLGGDCCAAGLVQTLSCVLPVSGCDKRWNLYRPGSALSAGSVSSHRLPTFKQSPTIGCLYHRLTRFYAASPLNPIFMLGGAPEAHDVLSKTPRISFFFHPKPPVRGVSDQG